MFRILLVIVISCTLQAEIRTLSSYSEFSPAEVGKGDWVMFDIDRTLLIHSDPLLRYENRECLYRLWDQYGLEEEESEQHKSSIALQAKYRLVEPACASLICQLEDKNATIFAFTLRSTASWAQISSVEDWSFEQLKELGLDFSLAFANEEITFNEFNEGRGPARYSRGILFSSNCPKAAVFERFLAFRERPTKVFFFDDRLDNLQEMDTLCAKWNIPFVGLHYVAADRLGGEVAQDDARIKLQLFFETGHWDS